MIRSDSLTALASLVNQLTKPGLEGDNTIIGDAGDNLLSGFGGNDRILGRAGNDTLEGGDGQDTLFGETGADSLFGGDGDDRLFVDIDDVLIDGGAGFDRVIVRDSRDFSIDQAATGIERVDAGAGNDTLDASGLTGRAMQFGNAGNDTLTGGAGHDLLRGGEGDDLIRGNAGNDALFGDAGVDALYGGAGNDRLYVDVEDSVIDGGAGFDQIVVQTSAGFSIDQAATSIERADGNAGDDRFDASAVNERVLHFGKGGNDTLIGGAGNDFQRGGDGDDSIFGGAGNDNLFGDAGADALSGGDGDDRLNIDRDDTVIEGGAGFDRVVFRDTSDFSIDLAATGVERVDSGIGNDVLDGSGLTGRSVQTGNAGDDNLIGGTANDFLRGGDGDDLIEGGAGNDVMFGDAGADRFVVGANTGTDIIQDFTQGADIVVLQDTGTSFADLEFRTTGAETRVSIGDSLIRLRGTADIEFTEDDFEFVESIIGFVPPEDSGVIDVADFGIIADDGIDDTAAIQALFDQFQTRVTYFFGDGVYDISDTLVQPAGLGTTVPSVITIQGQSEAGTIFKLADGLDHQGPILAYPGGVAQAFNNRIRDVTFDIGTGNTNATGLQFAGNNQSTIKDVTIRSGEGGNRGLDLVGQGEFGPALIEGVTVEGFETGIAMAFQVNSVTLEDITLVGQDVGISNTLSHVAFLRDISYEGPGIGFNNASFSRAVLLESSFTSTDASIEDQAAVRSILSLYANDVRADGFDFTIDSTAQTFQGNGDVTTPDSDEYIAFGAHDRSRGGTFELFESPDTSLGLTVEETPETVLDTNVGTWVSVTDFGAVEGQDATTAFQAAIDSGATTVYIPNGRWDIGEVIVRGNVEQILGFGNSQLEPDATFRIADGTADTVIVEGLRNAVSLRTTQFLHDTDRTLVLRDVTAFDYAAIAEEQGDVFFANVVGRSIETRDQNVWARQLNLEGNNAANGIEAKLVNDGADVWILGIKTEGAGTVVKTVNDGRTEVYGAYHNGEVDFDIPRYVTEGASLFAAITEGSTNSQGFDLVRETRDGVTREGRIKEDVRADAYAAFDASAIADQQIIIDNDQAVLTGAWQDAGAGFPGGFLGGNFLFAEGGSDAAITYEATAATAGTYIVSLRDIEDRGGQSHSGHTRSVDIAFGTGDDSFVYEDMDMVDAPGLWETLGVVTVDAGERLFVSFEAAGVSGKILADAVRFERVEDALALTDGPADALVV